MKKNISQKTFKSIIYLAISIFLFTSIAVGLQYWYNMKAIYTEQAYALTSAASNYIDGNKLVEYYNGEPLDDYYMEVQHFLDSYGKTGLVEYFYVIVPEPEAMVYIWDAHIKEEYDVFGNTELYTYEEYEAMMSIMSGSVKENVQIYNTEDYGFLATTYSPIKDDSGRSVGLVAVDISMPNVIRDITSFILAVAFCIIFVIVISSFFYTSFIRKNIVSPLARLKEGSAQMVSRLESDELNEISLNSGDEFEDLANSFNSMNTELRDYIDRLGKVTAERERIGAELNVATQIQADMLPTIFPAFPDRKEIDIYAKMDPAKEVGGDFYDFFEIGGNKIGLVMADVSGKGVPAALFMVIAKTLIKNHALQGYSAGEILSRANRQLCEGNKAELFVTVWIAIVDITTGDTVVANAGHEHPAVRRANGEYELVKYRHSPAVAIMEDIPFKEHSFKLNKGDCLFVYTDGVTEATDSANCLFGEERLIKSLNSHKHLSPKELVDAVRSDIDAFTGDAPQFDDITMMAFYYFG